MEVMQNFNSYMDIPQVKQLSDQVRAQVLSLKINRTDPSNVFSLVFYKRYIRFRMSWLSRLQQISNRRFQARIQSISIS